MLRLKVSLTSLNTKTIKNLTIDDKSDIDRLFQEIDVENEYKMEIYDDNASVYSYNENLCELLSLLRIKNSSFCFCKEKPYGFGLWGCSTHKQPLNNIKVLLFDLNLYKGILQRDQYGIDTFINLKELYLFFRDCPTEINIDFSYLTSLEKLSIKNCILTKGSAESLLYLYKFKVLVIENIFLNEKDDLIHFFETFKKRTKKLETIVFR